MASLTNGLQIMNVPAAYQYVCLLYTSDAADDLLCVDLGGRRIIKKKKQQLDCFSITGPPVLTTLLSIRGSLK